MLFSYQFIVAATEILNINHYVNPLANANAKCKVGYI